MEYKWLMKKRMESKFCIPHKPVAIEAANSTKVKIVYDALPGAPSLNECLEPRPTSPELTVKFISSNEIPSNCSNERSETCLLASAYQ